MHTVYIKYITLHFTVPDKKVQLYSIQIVRSKQRKQEKMPHPGYKPSPKLPILHFEA